jgi:hypothetical protein
MCFLARPGQYCQIEQLHVAELGARAAQGACTVTNAKVGRISWTKGKSENRGSRGMIGLTMT